jgi:hypothetical protein
MPQSHDHSLSEEEIRARVQSGVTGIAMPPGWSEAAP